MKASLMCGSVFGLTAVILGALASHKWQGVLDASAYSALQTAVAYQFYHALVLVLVGMLQLQVNMSGAAGAQSVAQPWLRASAICFMLGVVLFSGSLYALALTDVRGFGPVTPVGGVSLIAGWLCLAMAAYRLQIGVPK